VELRAENEGHRAILSGPARWRELLDA
jgi:hypothetical protein